jgi:O-acetyl-ADP-ribose deacetylase (regulator of RNase III)
MKNMISKNIYGVTIELLKGDITEQETEAIVNAANKKLSPGGGVSGAIHKEAGPELWDESKNLGGCETGEAKITSGYDLKAEYVIHTVGPVYSGEEKDKEYLQRSYQNSLRLAVEKGIESISFPAISTGIFGYPVEEAAEVAIEEIINFLKENGRPERVRIVLYNQEDFNIYWKILEQIVC